MQRLHTVLRTFGIVTFLGMAYLALPSPAHARVNVSIDIGVPVYPAPVVVYPAPVVVSPAPVVVVQPPLVYGGPVIRGGYYYRYPQGYWGHYHYRRW